MNETTKHSIGIIRYNYLSLTLIFFYCRDFFYLVFQRVVHNEMISQVFCLLLIYGCFLICVSRNRKRIKADAIILLLLIAMLFIFSYILNPSYRIAIIELESWNAIDSVFTFSSGIFAYLFFRSFDDDEQLLKSLKPCAYILLIWALFRINSSITSGGFSRVMQNGILSQNNYDMSTGYRLLFVSLVFGLEFLKRSGIKKVWYAILAAGSAVGMLIYGSRTAAVSWVLFWVLRMLFCTSKRHDPKKVITLIAIFVMSILVTNVTFLSMVSDVLAGFGLQSRMLNTLVQQEVTLDTGRFTIWNSCLEMIKSHPFVGCGIFADRATFGIYCHQFFLEILIDFGCIRGGLLIVALIWFCIKSVLTKDNSEWKLMIVLFLSLCIVRLALSSSFWMDTNYWAMLALIVNQKEYLKKQSKFLLCC